MMPFVHGVAALSRAQVALTKATSNVVVAVGAVACHSLKERELDRLAVLIYDTGSLHRSDRIDPWEHRWWAGALPKRPGRVLVAACGAGRELLWLLERGWEVEGFDPAPSLVASARARVGGRARVECLDFAAFVSESHRRERLDAILIGSTALSHCLSDASRRALVRACAALCPRGPILMSWQDGHTARGNRGRAHGLSARVGRALGALRGLGGEWRECLSHLPHAGPTAFLEPAELHSLAKAAGRRLAMRSTPMPHGEMLAGDSSSRADAPHEVAVELLGEVLRRRGEQALVARGGSMKPTILGGARVHLASTSGAQLGDVVAARVNGTFLVHRVVGMDSKGRLLLKGDACPGPDGWIDPRDVVAKVASIDDGSGPRPVPPAGLPLPRWRRGLARLGRSARALTGRDAGR